MLRELADCSWFARVAGRARVPPSGHHVMESQVSTMSEMELERGRRPERLAAMRLQNLLTSVGLFAKLLASFMVAAYEGWVRNQQAVVTKFREKSLLPQSLLLFLTALSEYLSYPSSTTFRIPTPGIGWFPVNQKDSTTEVPCPEPEPEKSVHVEVLYDPAPAEPIRADIIFIHGLHGSIVHTWKQGLWHYRTQVENVPLPHAVPPPTTWVENSDGCEVTKPRVSRPSESNTIVMGEGEEDHDKVLEDITDIINTFDDKMQARDARAGDNEETYSPCWPSDWLPKDCPGVRVIALNYTTDPFLWRPAWITKRIRTSLKERSREMIEHLLAIGVGQNPIVWVGHSKGGLFAKQMLVDASYTEDVRLQQFLVQTKGIMFYSVPHRGSSLAYINLPLLRQSVELTEVKRDCHEVLALHKEFMKLIEEKRILADIFSFVETVLTFMFVTNVRVVSVESADLGFGPFQGVNIDHREICKPLNRNCFLYKELVNLINKVV